MRLLAAIVICVLLQQNGINISERLSFDESLVLPGVGAEKMEIGKAVGQLDRVYKADQYKYVKVNGADLFQDVFHVRCDYHIRYTSIRYYKNSKAVFFINDSRIEAIAGLSNERVTDNMVELAKGAEYFIMNYGNKSLDRIKEGLNTIYIYPSLGIAVVDDDGDDSIDIFIVFRAFPK